jgi:hypothetical protein
MTPRPVYLVDFSVYKPPEECRFNYKEVRPPPAPPGEYLSRCSCWLAGALGPPPAALFVAHPQVGRGAPTLLPAAPAAPPRRTYTAGHEDCLGEPFLAAGERRLLAAGGS